MTDMGPLDLLGTVEGGVGYRELLPQAGTLDVDGRAILVLRLEKLLELKRRWTDPESQARAAVYERTLKGS